MALAANPQRTVGRNGHTVRMRNRGGRRPKGITNSQARELARLCRLLGRPYPGSGMSLLEASRTIAELRLEVERQRQPRTGAAHAPPHPPTNRARA